MLSATWHPSTWIVQIYWEKKQKHAHHCIFILCIYSFYLLLSYSICCKHIIWKSSSQTEQGQRHVPLQCAIDSIVLDVRECKGRGCTLFSVLGHTWLYIGFFVPLKTDSNVMLWKSNMSWAWVGLVYLCCSKLLLEISFCSSLLSNCTGHFFQSYKPSGPSVHV